MMVTLIIWFLSYDKLNPKPQNSKTQKLKNPKPLNSSTRARFGDWGLQKFAAEPDLALRVWQMKVLEAS